MALDMNFTWTDISTLKEPVYTFIFDPRIGKTFNFKNPKRNISVWIGGFRLAIDRNTDGSIDFNEVFDTQDWGSKIEVGQIKV